MNLINKYLNLKIRHEDIENAGLREYEFIRLKKQHDFNVNVLWCAGTLSLLSLIYFIFSYYSQGMNVFFNIFEFQFDFFHYIKLSLISLIILFIISLYDFLRQVKVNEKSLFENLFFNISLSVIMPILSFFNITIFLFMICSFLGFFKFFNHFLKTKNKLNNSVLFDLTEKNKIGNELEKLKDKIINNSDAISYIINNKNWKQREIEIIKSLQKDIIDLKIKTLSQERVLRMIVEDLKCNPLKIVND